MLKFRLPLSRNLLSFSLPKTDPAQELSNVRYQVRDLSPEEYSKKAAKVITDCAAAERKISGPERERWFDSLQTIVNRVRPIDKVWLLKRIQGDALCSNAEFGKLMAGAATSISFQKTDSLEKKDPIRRNDCVKATTALAEYLVSLPVEIKREYFAAMRKY